MNNQQRKEQIGLLCIFVDKINKDNLIDAIGYIACIDKMKKGQ